MKLEFALRIFEKYTNAKFNENPSSGSRVYPSGWRNVQTDMTMVLSFRNFANAPKNKAKTNALRNYEKYSTGRLQVQLQDLQNTIINLPASKRHGISSPAVQILASKIQIYCVELIMISRTLNCVCKAFGQT